jgi:hypothetical protein
MRSSVGQKWLQYRPSSKNQNNINGALEAVRCVACESASMLWRSAPRSFPGFFGYFAGAAPTLGTDGQYQVAAKNVRFSSEVAEDEIDLDSGFLIIPESIPQPSPVPAPDASGSPQLPPPGAGGGLHEPHYPNHSAAP